MAAAATTEWDKADHAKVLAVAKELRGSDATRQAVLNGKSVSYVKGDKFVAHFEGVKRMSPGEVDALGNAFLRENLVIKCEVADKARKLLRATMDRPKVFEREGYFYVWTFEGSAMMRNALLMLVVGSVLGLILFPVWPQAAKVGVWYLSMTLLIVLTGFLSLRLGLFLVLYGVGVDFWILPNFFADDVEFWDSFKPLVSLEVCNLTTLRQSIVYRVLVLGGLVSFVYWVLTQPTEFDTFVAQQRAFVDELYEGTLLSDKSQKDKDNIDKAKAVPDAATLERELAELERAEREEAAQRAKLDAMVDEAVQKDSL